MKDKIAILLWLVVVVILVTTVINNWEDLGLVLAWIAKFGF